MLENDNCYGKNNAGRQLWTCWGIAKFKQGDQGRLWTQTSEHGQRKWQRQKPKAAPSAFSRHHRGQGRGSAKNRGKGQMKKRRDDTGEQVWKNLVGLTFMPHELGHDRRVLTKGCVAVI